MKRINNYIQEKLHINNTTKIEYMYHPKTKEELIKAIQDKIDKEGLGTEDEPLDLNDIDTSKITDMSNLFDAVEGSLIKLSDNGNFDISDWDVSNVTNMEAMFYHSEFNGDISQWDVSNVENMSWMFLRSKFTGKNGDISDWNVKSLKYTTCAFLNSSLQNNPPKWYKV